MFGAERFNRCEKYSESCVLDVFCLVCRVGVCSLLRIDFVQAGEERGFPHSKDAFVEDKGNTYKEP